MTTRTRRIRAAFCILICLGIFQPELTEEGWIFRDPTHKPVEGEEPEYIHLGQCIIWDANDDTVVGDIKVSPAQDENKWIVNIMARSEGVCHVLYESSHRRTPATVFDLQYSASHYRINGLHASRGD